MNRKNAAIMVAWAIGLGVLGLLNLDRTDAEKLGPMTTFVVGLLGH